MVGALVTDESFPLLMSTVYDFNIFETGAQALSAHRCITYVGNAFPTDTCHYLATMYIYK